MLLQAKNVVENDLVYVHGKAIRKRNKKIFRQRNGRSSFLRIRKVQKMTLACMYRCVARNKHGSFSKQLNLTVTGGINMKLLKSLDPARRSNVTCHGVTI